MIKVEVKWQKEVFKDVEIDPEQPPSVFKTQLFSLSGVPPERQKVMGFKGGLLKDDADWAKAGLNDGLRVTMMGTADAAPEAPKQAQTFVEDFPEEEQDHTGLAKYGAGLQNLGNTCYMNSVIQNLYAVPELRDSLQLYKSHSAPPSMPGADAGHSLTVSLSNLFHSMEKSAQAVPPLEFLLALRRCAPQFAAQAREGHYMQQDAEECWGVIATALRTKLQEIGAATAGTDGREGSKSRSFDELFGVTLQAVLKSEESGEILEVNAKEYSMKANINLEVNHLGEGLKLGLKADREQRSDALGRDTVFQGDSKISKLPPNLMVQMVRFFYKQDVQQKAKILRKVTFPLVLDAYEFCTDGLKKELQAPRLAAKEEEDRKAGLAAAAAAAAAKKQKIDNMSASSDAPMDLDVDGGGSGAVVAAVAPSQGNRLTGKYDLVGVLTHKGRSADSGHYVSWVKQDDGSWIQFDDDEMIPRKEEEVLALSGGGDWHMAYLLLYRAQRA